MHDDGPFKEYGSEIMVIRELFDGANELFENELERALEIGCQTIIIEPCRLGEETARWIYVGDCISKTSIISGIGSILSGLLCPDKSVVQYSLLASSLLTNCFHVLSWQSDPCSYYRVERNQDKLSNIIAASKYKDNISMITSSYPPSPSDTNEPDSDETLEASKKLFGTIKNKLQPVILCRRTNNEIRHSNLLTAAVSLIAFAFSMLRLFKPSFIKWTLV